MAMPPKAFESPNRVFDFDKNSLLGELSIGDLALCVKEKAITTYGGFRLCSCARACEQSENKDGIFRVYVVIVVRRNLSVCIIYVATNWWGPPQRMCHIGPGCGFGKIESRPAECLYFFA
jgi:hypothetical protein